MIEVWKPIPAHLILHDYLKTYLSKRRAGLKTIREYEASSMGRVRIDGRIRPEPTRGKYSTVSIRFNGVAKGFHTHRLVAITFLKRKRKTYVVNHKNLVKSDNRVCNLEWISKTEDARHSWANRAKAEGK